MIVERLLGFHPSDEYCIEPGPPSPRAPPNRTEAALLGYYIKAQGAKVIRSLTLL